MSDRLIKSALDGKATDFKDEFKGMMKEKFDIKVDKINQDVGKNIIENGEK